MTETRPPYGKQEEPEAGMVGIRLEASDMRLVDQLRGDESRAGYCRQILRAGLADELEKRAAKLRSEPLSRESR